MLPESWVDEIFARLAVRYGSRWASMWQGLPIEAVRADWSDQLDGMTPDAIRRALASLPDDFPPTAPAFRKLGSVRAESMPAPALPAPSNLNSPAAVKAREKLRELVARLRVQA